MGKILKLANFRKTIYYLKKNGIKNAFYAARERIDSEKEDSYCYQGLAEEFPAPLKAGDTVTAGQVIASCGATALIECAEPDHIHYSLQIGGVSVDPGDYMTLTYAATEVED